jgi:hypothetical protein
LLADVEEPDGRTAFCHVERLEFASPAGTHGAKYRRTGLQSTQLVRDIVCAVVWSGTGNVVTVLYPAHVPVSEALRNCIAWCCAAWSLYRELKLAKTMFGCSRVFRHCVVRGCRL